MNLRIKYKQIFLKDIIQLK